MSQSVAVSADGDGDGVVEEKIQRPSRRALMGSPVDSVGSKVPSWR